MFSRIHSTTVSRKQTLVAQPMVTTWLNGEWFVSNLKELEMTDEPSLVYDIYFFVP